MEKSKRSVYGSLLETELTLEMEPSYYEATVFNYDLSDPAIQLNGLIGNTEYMPLFSFGMITTTVETVKKAFVAYEHENMQRSISFDVPTVGEIMIRKPKRTNGFLVFKNSFLRALKNDEVIIMPHIMTEIAGSVWRATHDTHKEVFLSLANKVMNLIRSDVELTDAATYYEFVCCHCSTRNRISRRVL